MEPNAGIHFTHSHQPLTLSEGGVCQKLPGGTAPAVQLRLIPPGGQGESRGPAEGTAAVSGGSAAGGDDPLRDFQQPGWGDAPCPAVAAAFHGLLSTRPPPQCSGRFSVAMSNDREAEVAWMRRVKRGDSEAFTLFVDRYRQPLLNLCYRVLGDAAEARDVAQAAFVQVFKHAGRCREGVRFSTWLYTIARNLCLNELAPALPAPSRFHGRRVGVVCRLRASAVGG